MSNAIYNRALSELATTFGSSFSNLESGTGARVQSAKKGKMTIYHRNIAAGNQAEIAFDVPSLAARIRLSESETISFLAELKLLTGRPVELNRQYLWPRVGFATDEHVTKVIHALKARVLS